MPSALRNGTRPVGSLAIVLVLALAITLLYPGCAERRGGSISARQYPPPPQTPRVVALGELLFGRAPTDTQVQLSLFFFGVEPDPPAGLIRPIDVTADGGELYVCDTGLQAVFQRDAEHGAIRPARFDTPPQKPVAIEIAANGDRLVADMGAAAVLRYDRAGRLFRQYALANSEFRPASALEVDSQVWVTNIAAHGIEVFDRDSGEHLRTIGERGSEPGRFGIPLGMARTPNGNVCVVDMLNNRVQVLSAEGKWIRHIGGPGNRVGEFGRPTDVAVGPDGTVFVSDVASQRIHAFSPAGAPLLAFGEPGSHRASLELPGGICIVPSIAGAAETLPPEFDAAYYILVAEQTRRPGLRVFAWGAGSSNASPLAASPGDELIEHPRRATAARVNAAGTANPHWSPEGCATCHGDERQAISVEQADTACLACHDGKRALAEFHPVGRIARNDRIATPSDWPLNNGRLACLTCHEIRRHCDASAARPLDNPAMLREFDVVRPYAFCSRCHVSQGAAQISPHRQLAADGGLIEETCRYCHNSVPAIPHDGARRSAPDLRIASSQLCLSCHSRHWDFSQRGHVERPMPDTFNRPAELPLADGNVACYSCHNPHQAGLFPAGSVLGARATVPIDAAVALRMNSMELCIACHIK